METQTKLECHYENSCHETISGHTEVVELEADSYDQMIREVAEHTFATCRHDWVDVDEMIQNRAFCNFVFSVTSEVGAEL